MKRRRDENEKSVVRALEAAGALVFRIECRERSGCPDILVMYRGQAFAMEVKTATGRVLESQKIYGVHIVRDGYEAIEIITGVKK